MAKLREKIINVLKSLEKYYRNLGDAYNTVSQEIQNQYNNLPSVSIFELLKIVNKYRNDLNSLDIQKFSRMRYERIRLLLDRIISVLRMHHLLEMLKEYGHDEVDNTHHSLEGLEKHGFDEDDDQEKFHYDTDEDEDDPVATLENYTKDDDVYVA
jgi:hypothetical protein